MLIPLGLVHAVVSLFAALLLAVGTSALILWREQLSRRLAILVPNDRPRVSLRYPLAALLAYWLALMVAP